MIRATALLFSSHNRCEHIHRDWIVQRALESLDNKTVFLIPFSMDRHDQQEYSWGTFKWYFRKFEQWGLRANTFFWNDNLTRQDAEVFFHHLYNDQVVILGGGNSELGMERYTALGQYFFGDPGMTRRILHERQNRGLLTVGFSAGSDQLGELLHEAVWEAMDNPNGFGLAKNVMTTLHHERGREEALQHSAHMLPSCLVFGLPNDSGIAVDQGHLPSGNIWQIIEVIIDNTWDLPQDAFHIKTRMGMKVEHYYHDGRHWSFNHGDRIIRIMSPDGRGYRAWISPAGSGRYVEYHTQRPSGFSSIDEIFAHH